MGSEISAIDKPDDAGPGGFVGCECGCGVWCGVLSLSELQYGSSPGSIELQVHRFGAHGIRQSQLSSGPIDTHKYADEAAGGDSRAGAWRVP